MKQEGKTFSTLADDHLIEKINIIYLHFLFNTYAIFMKKQFFNVTEKMKEQNFSQIKRHAGPRGKKDNNCVGMGVDTKSLMIALLIWIAILSAGDIDIIIIII